MQGRDIAIILGAVALIVLLFGLMAGGMMMGPGMMGWGGFGFAPWWGLAMLLFWVLILTGGALLLLWLFRQGRPVEEGALPGRPRALDILEERYARGEITREQFEQMRQDLMGR